MNNIKPSLFDPQEVLSQIGKNLSKDKKNTLKTLTELMRERYELFSDNKHSLELIQPLPQDAYSKFMGNLYKRDRAVIKNLWNDVIGQNGSMFRCPICGIDTVYHLDHYMPKSIFPEFSIHPHNLIPLCAKCNDNKSQQWLDNNKNRVVFNAYYDQPKVHVLECSITISENNLPHVEIFFANHENQWTIHERTINALKLMPRITDDLQCILGSVIESIKNNYDNSQDRQQYYEKCKNYLIKMTSNEKVLENLKLLYDGIVRSIDFEKWIIQQL